MPFSVHPIAQATKSIPPAKEAKRNRDLAQVQSFLASGKFERAEREAAKLLKRNPHDLGLLLARAHAALQLGRVEYALSLTKRAQNIAPQNEQAVLLKAQCLFEQSNASAGLAELTAFLDDQDSWRVRHALAKKLMHLRRYAAALDVLRAGLNAASVHGVILEMIGQCFRQLDQNDQAIETFELGMRLDPNHTANFLHRAFLAHTREGKDPRVHFLSVLQKDPENHYALIHFLWASLARCDWNAFDALAPGARAAGETGVGKDTANAWFYLPIFDDPGLSLNLQTQTQKRRLAGLNLTSPQRVAARAKASDGRIRLGYYSNDFYDHATTRLFSGVLRHHDPSRFEIHCLDYGKNDAFGHEALRHAEHVHAVPNKSDAEITAFAETLQLDIAVDLKGDTQGGRSGLFLLGQAPVQINYLGYPGTMGSTAYDYIIADDILIPKASEKFYSEQIIRLPTCYLPCDDHRRADLPPTRTELGLPEDAVVLACLNEPYKISREGFTLWMKALKAVPDAVLWLLDSNQESRDALLETAKTEGIDTSRIVFADKIAHQEHITRLAQADLYLDTFNCNAHTLAAEAICASGVPLLTRVGEQFAARVGASFATAAGLPELVTETSEDYLTKLIEVASSPSTLLRLRGQIALNRSKLPLFSSAKYTRLLEESFVNANALAQKGRPPRSFTVSNDMGKGGTA